MPRNVTLSAALSTIENPSYLIPPGTYALGLHRWTKSGQLVPILRDVPGRTYILIHNGTRPEHSHGCILAPQPVVDALVTLIQHAHETVTLTIAPSADGL